MAVVTLREHLEAIVERNAPTRPHHDPGDDYRDAVAALAILDSAERERNDSRDPSNRYPLDRVLIDDPPWINTQPDHHRHDFEYLAESNVHTCKHCGLSTEDPLDRVLIDDPPVSS